MFCPAAQGLCLSPQSRTGTSKTLRWNEGSPVASSGLWCFVIVWTGQRRASFSLEAWFTRSCVPEKLLCPCVARSVWRWLEETDTQMSSFSGCPLCIGVWSARVTVLRGQRPPGLSVLKVPRSLKLPRAPGPGRWPRVLRTVKKPRRPWRSGTSGAARALLSAAPTPGQQGPRSPTEL